MIRVRVPSQPKGPQAGQSYLHFNGVDNYVEVPTADEFSVATTGSLTIAAWIRPDVLDFPHAEGSNQDYVYWLGKGDGVGAEGQQEWACRMYNQTNSEKPSRANRISFYVFNPEGGLGVGSHVQQSVFVKRWIHIVAIADHGQTSIYRNGVYIGCDLYQPESDQPEGGHTCTPHFDPHGAPLIIDPRAGSAPLRMGTLDRKGFFEGGIWRFRIWNRALSDTEVAHLYGSDKSPKNGLVSEYLLDAGSGETARDSAGSHDGSIFGASWAVQ